MLIVRIVDDGLRGLAQLKHLWIGWDLTYHERVGQHSNEDRDNEEVRDDKEHRQDDFPEDIVAIPYFPSRWREAHQQLEKSVCCCGCIERNWKC